MARSPKFAAATVNAQADLISDLLDGGKLRLYDSPKPATADDAITTQTLLAELTFGSPSAPAASDGVLVFNAITSDPSANATGTAAWARLLKSDGTTVVCDGTVGTAATDIVLVSTAIVAAAVVPLAGLSLTIKKG